MDLSKGYKHTIHSYLFLCFCCCFFLYEFVLFSSSTYYQLFWFCATICLHRLCVCDAIQTQHKTHGQTDACAQITAEGNTQLSPARCGGITCTAYTYLAISLTLLQRGDWFYDRNDNVLVCVEIFSSLAIYSVKGSAVLFSNPLSKYFSNISPYLIRVFCERMCA